MRLYNIVSTSSLYHTIISLFFNCFRPLIDSIRNLVPRRPRRRAKCSTHLSYLIARPFDPSRLNSVMYLARRPWYPALIRIVCSLRSKNSFPTRQLPLPASALPIYRTKRSLWGQRSLTHGACPADIIKPPTYLRLSVSPRT